MPLTCQGLASWMAMVSKMATGLASSIVTSSKFVADIYIYGQVMVVAVVSVMLARWQVFICERYMHGKAKVGSFKRICCFEVQL